MSPDKLPIVLLGGLDNALLGCPSRAQASYQGAILTTQDHYVWVRLVEVVAKLGKPGLFHLSSSPFRPPEEVSATKVVGKQPLPDPPAGTAAVARLGSARPRPRALLPRSNPRPCQPDLCAALSCGGRPP